MDDIIGRVADFGAGDFAARSDLYRRLAADGQRPSALIVSCAGSRIVPEHILGAAPGDLFVCRNAGNIVPPHGATEGVAATLEYALEALGVAHVIVCGHSDCGAMKAVADPSGLAKLPAVAGWLRHAAAAPAIADAASPGLDGAARLRALTLANIVAQLAHVRTHPAVAGRLATGALTLHGWYVDIHAGEVLVLDEASGEFAAAASVAAEPARVAA